MNLHDSFRIIYGILQDLLNSSEGISSGEIARKYGVTRRIVPKYISILEGAGVPVYAEKQRYYVDKSMRASFVLNPEESDFLVLMMERALTTQTLRSHTIYRLFKKLSTRTSGQPANFLTGLFSSVPMVADPTAFDRAFRVLSRARREGREADIEYLPLRKDEPTRWRIRPFRFATNPLSDGFYVLCEGTKDGETYLRLSLKFDRIISATMTDIRYKAIDQANFVSNEGSAWGVWGANQPPTVVKLRFERRQYDRLLESQWHHTQHLFLSHEDGYVYFSVKVAEPQEMIPWIRSWGADVVVLEPPSLRQQLAQSALRMAMAYELMLTPQADTPEAQGLYGLWAKYERKTGDYHPLIYHMLDVAAVAWHMWESVLSPSQRAWVCDCLGLEDEQAKRWLALMVGLHDIGKATPLFQVKAEKLYKRLGQKTLVAKDTPHGILSAVLLNAWLKASLDIPLAESLAFGIGGHHGAWISSRELVDARPRLGDGTWKSWQGQLLSTMQAVLGVESLAVAPVGQEQANLLSAFVSGFTSVCDWVGSDSDFFPYEMRHIDPAQYFGIALERAEHALIELRFFGWQAQSATPSFEALFGFSPNSLQESALAHLNTLPAPPKLILVEYLTGGGKTELALYIADLLIQHLKLVGMYVAMPTQATSNQMFERVVKFLTRRYPHEAINVQLAHGEADAHPLYREMFFKGNLKAVEEDGNESSLEAAQWFRGTKRALLAPYAVGTVDQAMLSVLQSKHHFVRQYALSHKVVIFDEIHSYDAYMQAIIARLNAWLTRLHAPMILLSATLSQTARQNLIAQVAPEAHVPGDVPYPRLTVVHADNRVETFALPTPPTRTTHLAFVAGDMDSLWDYLAPIYAQGGCIAIVCNTVNESIDIAQYIASQDGVDANDVKVFHARFPREVRQKREQTVLKAFGKDGKRPQRAILVATQVIEQSLDIDFDCMVSSVAPMDLLIQRIGRLHRHDRPRPAHLRLPTLVVRMPELKDDVPDFGVDEKIYARHILLKTWFYLRQRDALHVPDDLDALMNAVYSDEDDTTGMSKAYAEALALARQDFMTNTEHYAFRGAQFAIGEPSAENTLGQGSLLLDDGERAKTRDFLPSVEIACLLPEQQDWISDAKPLSKDVIGKIRLRCVQVTHQGVQEALRAVPKPKAWEKFPTLREVHPLIFDEAGECRLSRGNVVLRLSSKFGLEIVGTKEKSS
jgi:CRISPR-associated endonuclease/helicase Cas3